MKDVLKEHPQVVEYAREAIKRSGLEVKMESIRGGTDGSKLSFWECPAQIFLRACKIYTVSWNGFR